MMNRNRYPQLVLVLWVLHAAVALYLHHWEGGVSELMPGPPPILRVMDSIFFYGLVLATLHLVWLEGRNQWKNILLMAVSALLALLLGQAMIAVLYPELNNPNFAVRRERKYHHITPPNGRFIQAAEGGETLMIETNEDGFRSTYSRKSFQDHQVRIAILGDSFTFGLGVQKEQAFPDQLERMLRKDHGIDAAVLNCGVISYSPLLESLIYEDIVVHYRPTHTLLFLDATDIGDDQRYLAQADMRRGRPVFPGRDREGFRYWGFVIESFLSPVLVKPALAPLPFFFNSDEAPTEPETKGLYRTKAIIDGKQVDNRFFIYRHPLEKTRPYFDQTFGYVEQIAKEAESIGSEFQLVVYPRFHHWSKEECPNNWEAFEYGVDEPYQYELFRYFAEKAGQAPFPIIDLLPDFRNTDRFPLVFENDPHWNPDGHLFVAERILEQLKQTTLP